MRAKGQAWERDCLRDGHKDQDARRNGEYSGGGGVRHGFDDGIGHAVVTAKA